MDSENDVMILIIVMPVGHDLESCTTKIQHATVPCRGQSTRRIVFVDTPGFNDTWDRDKQIMNDIINWLASSCQGVKLGGVLYLNDISQVRIEPARENLWMFDTLCRPPAFQNVVLATTKWSDIPAHVGQLREQQLSEQYWTGAGVHRFVNTYDSAWDIVDVVLKKDPVDAVRFHQELDNLRDRLSPKAQHGFAGAFKYLFNRLSGGATER